MEYLSRFLHIVSVFAVAAGASHSAALPLAISPAPAGPLVFTLTQINGGAARFDVVNQTQAPQAVTAVIAGLFPLNAASGAGAPAIEMSGAPATIAAGAIQKFQLLPFKSGPGPGSYSGLLRLLINGSDALTPQPITITVAALDLLRTKDALTLFRWIPFCPSWWPAPWGNTLSIPVRGGNLLSGQPSEVIGAIGRDPAGGWTFVRWDASGTHLSVDNPSNPGTYTGDLILATDPSKITYTLSVTAKDAVICPALVIAIGITLAYFVKRYIGVLRVTWELRLQEAELGDQFKRSQVKFASATHGQPFGAYSISADVNTLRRTLLASIKAIEGTPTSTIDKTNQAFQNVLTELSNMQSGIDSWPDFGANLAKLSKTLTAVRASLNGAEIEPPQAIPPDPQFLSNAQALLLGSAITLAEFATIRQNVTSFGALAELWPEARQRAADLTDLFRRLSAAPGTVAHATEVTATQGALVALWVTLGSVQNVAGLNALLASGADFDKVQILLNQLQAILGPLPMRAPLSSRTAALISGPPLVQDWFQSLADSRGPASDERRANLLQARILRSDLAVAWFAFAIALITGLNQVYIGKPFGSLTDYVTLFIWAAATKTTLDIVLALADQLGVGLSPTSPKPTS